MISMSRVLCGLAASGFLTLGFAQPTPVDSLLQGKEYKLAPLDSSYRSKGNSFGKNQDTQATNKGTVYMIQFDAIADFDAAQARRADLQRRTGMNIQLVFDSPMAFLLQQPKH